MTLLETEILDVLRHCKDDLKGWLEIPGIEELYNIDNTEHAYQRACSVLEKVEAPNREELYNLDRLRWLLSECVDIIEGKTPITVNHIDSILNYAKQSI